MQKHSKSYKESLINLVFQWFNDEISKTIFLLIIIIIFQSPFEKLFIDSIAKYFSKSLRLDVIFGFVTFYIFYLLIKRYKNNYTLSNNHFLIQFILLCFFIYYRFFCENIELIPTTISDKIKYLDIVSLYLLANIVFTLKVKFKTERHCDTKTENGFFLDKPLGPNENINDEFKRGEIAKSIVQKVMNTHSKTHPLLLVYQENGEVVKPLFYI